MLLKRISNFFNNTLLLEHNKAIMYMMVGGFAFATMGALTYALGKKCDWILIAFFRMLLTFVITFSLCIKSGVKPFVLNRPLLWFRSFVGCGAMLATFYSLTRLPVSDVSVVTETRPIWVALLAGVILGEYSGKKIWISIILSLIGVLLIEQPHITEKNFAVFAALLASFLGAIVMICLRKLRTIDPRSLVTHFTGLATVVSLLAYIILRDEPIFTVLANYEITLMLIGVGIFGTIGQLAMTKAFSIGEAPSVATAGFAKVGFSAFYDIVIWSRVFQLPTIIGMILILGSTTALFNSNIFRLNNRTRENF